jgi:hypothetical protein
LIFRYFQKLPGNSSPLVGSWYSTNSRTGVQDRGRLSKKKLQIFKESSAFSKEKECSIRKSEQKKEQQAFPRGQKSAVALLGSSPPASGLGTP